MPLVSSSELVCNFCQIESVLYVYMESHRLFSLFESLYSANQFLLYRRTEIVVSLVAFVAVITSSILTRITISEYI